MRSVVSSVLGAASSSRTVTGTREVFPELNREFNLYFDEFIRRVVRTYGAENGSEPVRGVHMDSISRGFFGAITITFTVRPSYDTWEMRFFSDFAAHPTYTVNGRAP